MSVNAAGRDRQERYQLGRAGPQARRQADRRLGAQAEDHGGDGRARGTRSAWTAGSGLDDAYLGGHRPGKRGRGAAGEQPFVAAVSIWRLDRLGRSLKGLIEFIDRLPERPAGLKSLTRSSTRPRAAAAIFHVFGALAEFERDLIRERTQAGLAAARARGRLGGRPKLLTPEKRKLAVQLYRAKEHSIAEESAA